MADHLARIYGTEEDKVNCPFYFKIGSCRHGDQCSRVHNRPVISQALLLKNLYQMPAAAIAVQEGQPVPDDLWDDAQAHFEKAYSEVFEELTRFGEVEDLGMSDNIADHLIGSMYVKFADEESAEKALKGLTGRFYAGRLVTPEYCPVTEFADARCKQYDDAMCSRGGYCNFVHWRHVPRAFKRRLYRKMYADHPEYVKSGTEYVKSGTAEQGSVSTHLGSEPSGAMRGGLATANDSGKSLIHGPGPHGLHSAAEQQPESHSTQATQEQPRTLVIDENDI